MTREEAIQRLCQLRWPATNGEPACPYCGRMNPYRVITVNNRRLFDCKACGRQFTATSGTKLHGCKLPPEKLVPVINALLAGQSRLQISRQNVATWKTIDFIALRLEGFLVHDKSHPALTPPPKPPSPPPARQPRQGQSPWR